MRRGTPTKTGKAMRMKFLCIISACPEGARKWHIQIFAMFYIANCLSGVNWQAVVVEPQNLLYRERIRVMASWVVVLSRGATPLPLPDIRPLLVSAATEAAAQDAT